MDLRGYPTTEPCSAEGRKPFLRGKASRSEESGVGNRTVPAMEVSPGLLGHNCWEAQVPSHRLESGVEEVTESHL